MTDLPTPTVDNRVHNPWKQARQSVSEQARDKQVEDWS